MYITRSLIIQTKAKLLINPGHIIRKQNQTPNTVKKKLSFNKAIHLMLRHQQSIKVKQI